MMASGLARMALGWATFLVLVGGVLLFIEPVHSAEFVVSVFTVGLGLLLGACAVGALMLSRHLSTRSGSAVPTDPHPADSTPPGRDR